MTNVDNTKRLLHDVVVKTKMSKQTLTLLVLLIGITILLVSVALFSPYSPPEPTTTTPVIKQPIQQTVLRFDEVGIATQDLIQESAADSAPPLYSLPLFIDTRRNVVTAVQVELAYDPEVLTNVSLAPGPFLGKSLVILNEVDQTAGKISYALGIRPQDTGKRGEGVVIIINFQTNTSTPKPTTVRFLPKTLVTAEGVAQSVLGSTVPAEFVVPLDY